MQLRKDGKKRQYIVIMLLKLTTVCCVSAPGQRPERGEGRSQTGRQHDPTGRQQPDGEGRHGDPQPRHGGGIQEEK